MKLDAIVTVIDAENFSGYEDTSHTARMQASYTDIILIVSMPNLVDSPHMVQCDLQNKWEHISERALDLVVDHLNTLNDLTPKIKCKKEKGVDPKLIFGVDSQLFLDAKAATVDITHNDEVETITIDNETVESHIHTDKCDHNHESYSSEKHEHTGTIREEGARNSGTISKDQLNSALGDLSKESVWRVKGFVRLEEGLFILNWAFGRFVLTALSDGGSQEVDRSIRLTVMGERGEIKRACRKFAAALGARIR